MSKMWEVDPETRSKLLEIQKTNENNKCVDCGAPSPQWISPKFGIFFCLACSGIHRSLGVHISFVRSATMDALKTGEVKRMEMAGNRQWKDFFNGHNSNSLIGRDFESCTIAERYDSEAGEEWKERLTAKVEGTEYVPGEKKPAPVKTTPKPVAISSVDNSGRSTPLGRSGSGAQRSSTPTQKERNEAYFAKMGNANATRSADLPPSQGGKYQGFGSAPPEPANQNDGGIPSADEFQKDPVAALTKGFGWLTSTVTKQAATVNRTYVQPGLKSLAEGDLAAQARATAVQLGTTVQQGTKGLGDQFNKFVDPDHNSAIRTRGGREPERADFWNSFGQAPGGPPPEKKDFWDDFAAAGEVVTQQKAAKPTSIGTSAMKKNGPPAKKDDDAWGEW